MRKQEFLAGVGTASKVHVVRSRSCEFGIQTECAISCDLLAFHHPDAPELPTGPW